MNAIWFWFGTFVAGFGSASSEWSSMAAESTRIHYVVSLENDGGQFCSGSIVGTKWILTLASCVRNKSSVDFAVGIQPLDADSGSRHERVRKIYQHQEDRRNSLALLRLRRSISWGDRVPSIDVVDAGANLTSINRCILLGWDRTPAAVATAVAPVKVEYVQLWCTNSSQKQEYCVHDYRRKFCEFQNGSPLVCKNGDTFQILALFAGQSRCSDQSLMDMFAGAVQHSKWISDTLSGAAATPADRFKNPDAMLEGTNAHSERLSKFNWLILAVMFFIMSVIIFIKVLRAGFTVA